MSTYTRPKMKSLDSNSLMELIGSAVTQYSPLNIGAARRAELNVHKDQVIICKNIPQKQNDIVRLG